MTMRLGLFANQCGADAANTKKKHTTTSNAPPASHIFRRPSPRLGMPDERSESTPTRGVATPSAIWPENMTMAESTGESSATCRRNTSKYENHVDAHMSFSTWPTPYAMNRTGVHLVARLPRLDGGWKVLVSDVESPASEMVE